MSFVHGPVSDHTLVTETALSVTTTPTNGNRWLDLGLRLGSEEFNSGWKSRRSGSKFREIKYLIRIQHKLIFIAVDEHGEDGMACIFASNGRAVAITDLISIAVWRPKRAFRFI